MAQSRLSNRGALLGILPLVAIAQAARKLHAADIPLGRCLRCKDWREVVVHQDDEPPPLATECACGFEVCVIHVVHVQYPITYLEEER